LSSQSQSDHGHPSDPLKSLHVIVPISSDERLWRDLLNDLVSLPQGSRVSLVGSQELNPVELEKIKNSSLFELIHLPSENHLATAMNHAAFSSQHEFMLFLHADSKIPKSTLANLQKALREKPDQIHYCQLQFLDDGPSLMFINSLAVQLRSRLLNLSFGHQGLALSKSQFEHVGGFNEELKSDVVQDFIWRAKQKGIRLSGIESPIYTSARFYKENGWGKATVQRFVKETKGTVLKGTRYLVERAFKV
jgi:hypothetical protein